MRVLAYIRCLLTHWPRWRKTGEDVVDGGWVVCEHWACERCGARWVRRSRAEG